MLVRDDDAGRRAGRIVEVEAYVGESDRASHARFGPTNRNRVMYGPPGIAYVYRVYGMYDLLNVVTEPAGQPAAVLIRALEPLDGADAMRAARSAHGRAGAGIGRLAANRLASGPGLVTAALGLDRSDTGTDLCDPASALRLTGPAGSLADNEILATPRIGVDYAAEPWRSVPWRFVIAGHRSASGSPRLR
ncbi:MAG TPA: DNA-3-methyladenine glycosylase [Candidatus Limnocylindrales bacterium]|nr:DNA-3-methyladenine glycosylase [Candidatus Limnocylindrales bacterium]